MKKFNHIYFCDYSQTYRSFPENYWLASVVEDKIVFDSWDRAIKKHSFKSDIKRLHQEIAQTRKEHKKLSISGQLIPVIVKSNFNGLGVQFWTGWQISNKKAINTDNTISLFISKL